MGVDITGLNPTIVSQEENLGEYFHSNWWAWRPIHILCDVVSQKYNLGINTRGWGENSGYGLSNANECNKLADAIENYIPTVFKDVNDDDVIYVCFGCWCTKDGKFISDENEDILEKDYPIGTILFNGVVLSDGTIVYPSHGSTLGFIKNWVKFLRNCGGFQIY